MHAKSILSLALLASLSGSVLLAQAPGGGFPMGPPGDRMMGGREDGMHPGFGPGPRAIWWHDADLAQKLGLTPDQQKRMDDIIQQSRLQLIDLRASVEKQELLMEPMLSANPPDTNKVLAQIDHIAQSRAELEKAHARMLLGIRGVLTPDQWTKLQAAKREGHRPGMGDGERRRGPGGPHGPGGPGGAGPAGGPQGGEGMMMTPMEQDDAPKGSAQ